MRYLIIICLLFNFILPVQASNPIEQAQTKVFFNNEALQGILDFIDMTEHELLVEMYDFTGHETVEPVFQALERAADRGCTVKIYLDNRGSNNPDKKDGTGFPEARMESKGIQVKWEPGSKTMHRKVWVSDKCTVFIGSTNISNNAFNHNDEIDIRLEDQAVVDQIKFQFNIDWENANETFYGEED